MTRRLVALSLALIGAGCEDRGNPAGPLAHTGNTVTRLEIVGPESVAPGRSLQLGATATLSDGTTRDVTGEVSWSSADPALMIVSPAGLVSAGHQFGEVQITARFTAQPSGQPAAGTASRAQLVLPEGTWRLTGLVKNEGVPVDGARVEITGETAGATVTKAGAFAVYGIAGDIEIRIAGDGLLPQVRRTRVTRHQSEADFHMLPALDGTYTLKVQAAADCRAVLPAAARERSYAAVVTQNGTDLDVLLKAPTIDPNGYERTANRFSGIVETGRVRFSLLSRGRTSSDWTGTILEDLTGAEYQIAYLNVSGSVTAATVRGGYAGTLDGRFEMLTASDYWDFLRPTGTACTSAAHQFTLTRSP